MMPFAMLLLAAAQPLPTPAWLAGRWVPVSDASGQDADACAGEDARLWRRDGSLAGDGWWRLEGTRLVEAHGDEADFGEREPAVSIIRRLAPDRMQMIDADGERIEWRRCR